MNYFDGRNTELFTEIIDSWRGTPYKHLNHVKSRAVDCSLFIGYSLLEAGILTEIKHGHYSPGWWQWSHDQFLLKMFREHFDKYMAPGLKYSEYLYTEDSCLIFGDILLFTLKDKCPVFTHAGIYIGNEEMIHSFPKRDVGTIKLGNYFTKRMPLFIRVEKMED